MPLTSIEERVALLEYEITQLKTHLNQEDTVHTPWWEQIAGAFENDPAFDEAVRLGQHYRKSQLPDNVGGESDDVST